MTINFQQLVGEMTNLMNRTHDERAQLLNDWVEREHPLQIGETAHCTHWSFIGKPFIVEKRGVRIVGENKYEWTASGTLIRANGTKGKTTVKWSAKVEPV